MNIENTRSILQDVYLKKVNPRREIINLSFFLHFINITKNDVGLKVMRPKCHNITN